MAAGTEAGAGISQGRVMERLLSTLTPICFATEADDKWASEEYVISVFVRQMAQVADRA
jgi:hypothetical protein